MEVLQTQSLPYLERFSSHLTQRYERIRQVRLSTGTNTGTAWVLYPIPAASSSIGEITASLECNTHAVPVGGRAGDGDGEVADAAAACIAPIIFFGTAVANLAPMLSQTQHNTAKTARQWVVGSTRCGVPLRGLPGAAAAAAACSFPHGPS